MGKIQIFNFDLKGKDVESIVALLLFNDLFLMDRRQELGQTNFKEKVC